MNTEKVKLEDLSEGDVLVADGGFTCMVQGEAKLVLRDDDGDLFVYCDEGKHYLDGQQDEDDEHMVGLERVTDEELAARGRRAIYMAAKGDMEALQGKRDALAKPLRDEIAKLWTPTDAQMAALEERFYAVEAAVGDTTHTCEECGNPIFDGEPVMHDPESGVSTCKDCSPTWQDFKDQPGDFWTPDGDHHTAESAAPLIEAHLAKGGKLSDSMAR